VVPPNQSEMMADALRRKGRPVAYITFAGEQHGFRKAENIIRSLEAELYFYGAVFGFEPADRIEPVPIDNLVAIPAQIRSAPAGLSLILQSQPLDSDNPHETVRTGGVDEKDDVLGLLRWVRSGCAALVGTISDGTQAQGRPDRVAPQAAVPQRPDGLGSATPVRHPGA
jgi:hypothetical protein